MMTESQFPERIWANRHGDWWEDDQMAPEEKEDDEYAVYVLEDAQPSGEWVPVESIRFLHDFVDCRIYPVTTTDAFDELSETLKEIGVWLVAQPQRRSKNA